ncbi:MAG TPA: NYN domain-containing protein [Burkholderiales bacterium]|nr:NYN domain-containing protein [Burkholderiales bacterium]
MKRILLRHPPIKARLRNLTGEKLLRAMGPLLVELQDRQRHIESKFKGWLAIQNGIAFKHRAIEFRRAGSITFNLFENRFVREKAVDVRLACDMIMLRKIYDTAIVVSGDQDYVPAVQVLKDAGKTVISVAFERRAGDLLPGGARQLNIATDASIRVPYPQLRAFMRVDPSRPALKEQADISAVPVAS